MPISGHRQATRSMTMPAYSPEPTSSWDQMTIRSSASSRTTAMFTLEADSLSSPTRRTGKTYETKNANNRLDSCRRGGLYRWEPSARRVPSPLLAVLHTLCGAEPFPVRFHRFLPDGDYTAKVRRERRLRLQLAGRKLRPGPGPSIPGPGKDTMKALRKAGMELPQRSHPGVLPRPRATAQPQQP